MLIYHWTSLAKNLNGAKRFDDYTVVIVSGNTNRGDAHLNTLWGGEMAGNQWE